MLYVSSFRNKNSGCVEDRCRLDLSDTIPGWLGMMPETMSGVAVQSSTGVYCRVLRPVSSEEFKKEKTAVS